MKLSSFWKRTGNDPAKVATITDTSFLTEETEEVYQAYAQDYLTSRGLNYFRRDPYLFHKNISGPADDEERPAHTLILEGHETYQQRYAFGGPVDPRTNQVCGRYTDAYTKWAAAQGKPAIDNEQAQLIDNLNEAVRGHPLAVELLSTGVAAGVVRTTYMGIPCQARLDWFSSHSGIVELTICESLSYFDWTVSVHGFVYVMAFNRALVFQLTGKLVPAYIIAVEKRPPYRAGVWIVGKDALEAAQKANDQAIERLMECRRLNRWPTGYEALRTIASL